MSNSGRRLEETKIINIKNFTLFLTLSFIYSLVDVVFSSGDYDINLYATGVHGIGDAIAKVLKSIFNIENPLFIGFFAASFYGIVNGILLILISFPKLDRKFSITTLLNSIFILFFILTLTYLINDLNCLKLKNFFNVSPSKGGGFGLSLVRVMIVATIGGLTYGTLIGKGSSSGGIDIISKYLNIYKKKDISAITCILNYLIAIISTLLIYFGTKEFQWESIILTNLVKIPLNTFFIYLAIKKTKPKKEIKNQI
ncbi:YitT family protein [Candidatus Phytoplasma pruni]|uniref:YitT family protein n=1 Tax=Candidatus Phytoplasma pruni TaxID=479893 RepID=A0A851HIL0_9MOLU|nr:YitT family protein [Candidatus Phytoplasma pruni]NWN45663.1 YitT family protein [Candidatus Phytoplasma pruni]